MAKAAQPMNTTQETPSTEPETELSEVATAFRSAFGPGFLALFWGGIGLWATGMITMMKMSSL